MSAWICGRCQLEDHGNHDDKGGCLLRGLYGVGGQLCACEWTADAEAIEIPVADLPAIVFANEYHPVEHYIANAAVELAVTEGHDDPLVRAVRKIAVQALVALSQLLDEDTAEEIKEDEGQRMMADSLANPPPAPHKRKRSASLELMDAHGITAAEVREWAARNGYSVSDRGALALEPIHAYIAAQAVSA
jgi:hypothetical protein